MATNPFYVQPLGGADIGGTLVGIGNILQERRAMEAEQAEKEAEEQRTAEGRQAVSAAYQSGDPNEVAKAMLAYPEMRQQLESAVKFRNQATKQNMLASTREILQNPDKTEEILRSRVAFVRSQGGDPTETEAELARYQDDPQRYQQSLEFAYAGLAPQQEWEAYQTITGRGGPQGQASAKTEIYKDGTTIQALPNQQVIVRNPAGDVVTGQERLNTLRAARESGLLRQQRMADIGVAAETRKAEERARVRRETEPGIAARIEGAKIGSKRAAELSDQIQPIRSTIAAFDEVIDLIDKGAKTGPIRDRLPSITSNARKLENIKRRLGLDVIAAGNFGSLSEGEMNVAMDTALPTGLEGPELRQWVIQRRDAQRKLADELRDAAIFLGQGNTVPEWIAEQERRRKAQGTTGQTVNWGDLQ